MRNSCIYRLFLDCIKGHIFGNVDKETIINNYKINTNEMIKNRDRID